MPVAGGGRGCRQGAELELKCRGRRRGWEGSSGAHWQVGIHRDVVQAGRSNHFTALLLQPAAPGGERPCAHVCARVGSSTTPQAALC